MANQRPKRTPPEPAHKDWIETKMAGIYVPWVERDTIHPEHLPDYYRGIYMVRVMELETDEPGDGGMHREYAEAYALREVVELMFDPTHVMEESDD